VSTTSPRAAGFHLPAEWEPHAACWLAWPRGEALWGRYLEDTRAAFVALCAAVAEPEPETGKVQGETLRILVWDAEDEATARAALRRVPAEFHRIPYGDIWLRDTAPIFLTRPDGAVVAACFGFNGWGGKYVFEHDDQVAARVAALSGFRAFSVPWVLEGGSIEVDGEGTCLTTRQCLLNPNRNPEMDQRTIEAGLREALAIEKVLWLDRGLRNDHTDGHVDTLARFVAPGVVVCMEATSPDDPNGEVLDGIARDLESFRDACGRRLKVIRIPSPGRLLDEDGELVPASYVNFYLGNRTVVVPVFGSPYDHAAVDGIAAACPGRRTIGIPARAVVCGGGGAFHCITRQEPVAEAT
jgi:agmatine deiminase